MGSMTMLDRVVMDVIQVARTIHLITNEMFPIPPLPDPALAFAETASGDLLTGR